MYVPKAIRGAEILKEHTENQITRSPMRMDRWLQQAVSQQLATRFELTFEEESHGFRPGKKPSRSSNTSTENINDAYQDIVDIDLKGSFDEVQHYKLLQLIYNR
ncbi:hypothetical protein V8V91_19425 [Algoriphagus halophilus]|uniref:hypothetical protein n=1 Tax=Algoriphagus halophilus TaxID=226505 RepID=UPI0035901B8D